MVTHLCPFTYCTRYNIPTEKFSKKKIKKGIAIFKFKFMYLFSLIYKIKYTQTGHPCVTPCRLNFYTITYREYFHLCLKYEIAVNIYI